MPWSTRHWKNETLGTKDEPLFATSTQQTTTAETVSFTAQREEQEIRATAGEVKKGRGQPRQSINKR